MECRSHRHQSLGVGELHLEVQTAIRIEFHALSEVAAHSFEFVHTAVELDFAEVAVGIVGKRLENAYA